MINFGGGGFGEPSRTLLHHRLNRERLHEFPHTADRRCAAAAEPRLHTLGRYYLRAQARLTALIGGHAFPHQLGGTMVAEARLELATFGL
jgi:hypothetical protein